MHLSIDIETYSSVDIKKSGLYKYVDAPDFSVLLFAYSLDGLPVQVVDFTAGEKLPQQIHALLFRADCIKHAYNAAFEWFCLSKHYNLEAPVRTAWLRQWRCTMLHGLYCGYPGGLGALGEALGLPQDKRKMGIGQALIRTFCTPCKPTNSNGNRTRTLPHHEPDKWQLFKQYNAQDVVTEMEIEHRLSMFPVPDHEQELWRLDQTINAYGVAVDRQLVTGALQVSAETTSALMTEAMQMSGLDNPKSIQQLTKWLEAETGTEIDDLQKDTVKELIKNTDNDNVRRMLEIRQEIGKTSVTKYTAMVNAACSDGRMRGLLQFYGANRTGRWAGRLVQVQNLPRNYLDTLDLARALTRDGKTAALKYVYGNVPDTLSQLIRTAFIPSPGNVFLVADFSAIEARVIAWLAGETWRQEVFKTHGKIYEASASAMFGVPIDLIKKGNPEYALRAKGKVAELALGYQGGAHALIAMGALNMGLSEAELPEIVQRWRNANKRIVDLWYAIENAALDTVQTGGINGINGLYFRVEGDYNSGLRFLTIQLPSGRKLYYADPRLTVNRFGRPSLAFSGVDQTKKKWAQQETYGGKLVENIVQATARDCLAVAMQRLAAAGFKIVMHVHDEVIIDCPDATLLDTACRMMGEPIDWAPGLILRADGFVSNYYKKD